MPDIGFGVAYEGMTGALKKLGHEVVINDPTALVEVSFAHPEWFFWSNPDSYNIGIIPWESSEVPETWFWHLDDANEIWATSPFVASVLETNKVAPAPVKVYLHGINENWMPMKRRRKAGKPLKFLSVGEPSERKGGRDTLQAFYDVFGEDPDYHLTIKAQEYNSTRIRNERAETIKLPQDQPNIDVILGSISESALISLYLKHDILVYPSWGEGFGLIPFQALATGMPTICTSAWAPYEKYLGSLALSSTPMQTQWELAHPGMMYRPDYEHLKELMRYAADTFDDRAEEYYAQAPAIHAEYDWLKLTEEAFRPIVEKFENS